MQQQQQYQSQRALLVVFVVVLLVGSLRTAEAQPASPYPCTFTASDGSKVRVAWAVK